MSFERFAVVASRSPNAQKALGEIKSRYKLCDPEDSEVIVALGGDGFMLETQHRFLRHGKPIYGMNRGTVGFLMNEFRADGLARRLDSAHRSELHPLRMTAVNNYGIVQEALAINEVSLLRQTRQAAKISVTVDSVKRVPELICDGVLVATPAGSTALGSNILALTPISAFRPRRWRGALLPDEAKVGFEIIEEQKRPVSAVADYTEVRDVASVTVAVDPSVSIFLLFDPEHNLEERILNEQFTP